VGMVVRRRRRVVGVDVLEIMLKEREDVYSSIDEGFWLDIKGATSDEMMLRVFIYPSNILTSSVME